MQRKHDQTGITKPVDQLANRSNSKPFSCIILLLYNILQLYRIYNLPTNCFIEAKSKTYS